MTDVAIEIAGDQVERKAGISVGALAATLLGLFAVDNLLLLHFWGVPLTLTAALILAAGTIITTLCSKFSADLPRVSYRTVALAFLLALALCLLGGEGNFFYANVDWQVRNAVLRDLATNPWPFAYNLDGTAYFLRAPLGTYLVPALFGANADVALLINNSLRFAILLSLAWHLFATGRQRAIVLGVFALFSGWDLVGTAFYSLLGQLLSWDHIENWNFGYQYSSNVTLAFWVPQHAVAGWTGAVTFLLWRKGLVPIGLFAASIPLIAIWSPLALMGTIPFAIFAGASGLRHRAIRLGDVALAATALAISVAAFLYLQLGASDVGMQLRPTPVLVWAFCILLEVLPFVWLLLKQPPTSGVDRPVIMVAFTILLVMPFVQVGDSSDFQMRASIMPLALLAIAFGEWVYVLANEKPAQIPRITCVAAVIALGAATPILELKRAVLNGPSPSTSCSLVGVWFQQDNLIVPYSSYLAPVAALPSGMHDIPVTSGENDPPKCWDREWATVQSPGPKRTLSRSIQDDPAMKARMLGANRQQ